MKDYGYAFFVKNPRRAEDLIRPHSVEQEKEYKVVKTIRLSTIDYENFITDMLADRKFLEENSALCRHDGTVARCLKICRRGLNESILVVPYRAWVIEAAIKYG